jgi:hypothetical protein
MAGHESTGTLTGGFRWAIVGEAVVLFAGIGVLEGGKPYDEREDQGRCSSSVGGVVMWLVAIDVTDERCDGRLDLVPFGWRTVLVSA